MDRNASARCQPFELPLADYKRRELDQARAAMEPRKPRMRTGGLYLYEPRERSRMDAASRQFEFISRGGVLEEQHRRAVVAAYRAGKRVPDDVLADYPELEQEQRKKTTKLSRVVAAVNDDHAPPGGFSDDDLVRA